jgi:hypothetical protein
MPTSAEKATAITTAFGETSEGQPATLAMP